MAEPNSHITILTLNLNGLNAPIKRQNGKLDKEPRLISVLSSRPISCVKTHRLKIKGWGRIYQVNGKHKKLGVAILVSNKTDFTN